MTREQEQELLWNRGVTTLERPAPLPQGVPQVAPTPRDEMAHAKLIKDLEARDFNQMSVDDAQALHELRQMDRLHQQDAAAGHYYKGLASKFEYEHSTTQEAQQKRNLLVSIINHSKNKKQ